MAAPPYRELVRSYLDLRWQLDPVAATQAGLETHDARLGAFGRADVKRALAALKAMAAAFEECEVDSLDDQIDQTAVLNDLRKEMARFEREKPHERNPDFHLSHLLLGLFSLLLSEGPLPRRARALAGRLADAPRFLREARAVLGRPAKVFTETAIAVARGGRTLLEEGIPAFAETLEPKDREMLAEPLSKAREALAGFSAFLGGQLADRSDGDFAIGRKQFDFRLHYEHALRETAPELLRYGEELVAEVEADLARRAEAIAPGVPWRALLDRMREDHPTSGDLVAAYAAEMARAREFVRSRDIVGVPDGDLDVVPTPLFMQPLIPFAAYDPPGAFAEFRTGRFYVSVPKDALLKEHCASELAATALHEGYPGHHLQHLVAYAQDSPVRRVVWSPLMVEGWALYCEELMAEQGFFSPPEALFQRYYLLWRAVRIVLDVKLHTEGMTAPQAVRYMSEVLGTAEQNAEAEVRRYCAAPAYQLCYAVGRRELLRLRDDYRERAGAAFSLRGFHDEVLRYGGLPVALVRWGMGLGDG